MKYDQYGRPLMSQNGYGAAPASYNQPQGTASHVTAKLDMPNLGQLGGHSLQTHRCERRGYRYRRWSGGPE